MVNGLRGDDRLHQGGTAGCGDKLPIPSWQISGALILKVEEVRPFEASNRKRQSKVSKGKGRASSRDALKNVIEIQSAATDGNHTTLLKICT
jgi:hypothetical protein